ncbi:MAG: nuclear transport factor 2 family protein [Pseudomonadota bacterium]
MSNETAAARAVIERYIEGTRSGDVSMLKSAFHPAAMMVGYLGPDLLTGGPEPFYQAMEANPPSAEAQAQYEPVISHLRVDGTVATATLEEKGVLGMNFVNHFLLIKDGEEWAINAKNFVVV